MKWTKAYKKIWQRKWRAKNPAKVQKYYQTYKDKYGDEIKRRNVAYYFSNRMRLLEGAKEWKKKNKDKIIKKNKEWCHKNREKIREQQRTWTRKNGWRYREKAKIYNSSLAGRYFRCKNAAKFRKLPFLLSKEEYSKFWQKPCFYCGGDMKMAGLDRIDNKQGYYLGNVVSCCVICNTMKMMLSCEEFITHCRKIVKKADLALIREGKE